MKSKIKAEEITAVSFDLDGTILRREFDYCLWGESDYEGTLWKTVGRHLGCSSAEAYRKSAQLIPQVKCGRVSINAWINYYGLRESEGEILESVEEPLRLYDDYSSFLINTLRAKNLRILLLTENSGELLNKKLNDTGIRNHFDRIYSSVELCGDEKSPTFYQQVLSSEGLKPERVAHFGDSVTKDYAAPLSIGMKAMLVHRVGISQEHRVPTHAQIKSLNEILEVII